MPKINSEYDIGAAFEAIENELIASMIRNMRRHKIEEIDEDKQWSMWQAEQLRALEKYRKENQERFGAKFKDINNRIEALISTARDEGDMEQEIAILEAIKKGFPARRVSPGASAAFFRLNQRKLEALIWATTSDMEKAETAVLRMANDQYRKIIFNAQVYANSGAGTYEKAVDMATKDFIAAGLNCVEYANGSRHTLADYADMAIRTASKRAYLQGEGQKRQEWGISTVIMNKRGNPCPKCLPFCGKVLIDDVWSGGSAKDGPYPLMSAAIAAGLYHPRCKDSHTTYFPELEDLDNEYSKKDIEDIEEQNRQEARQQYAERQEKKYDRLAKYSIDSENKRVYAERSREWNIEATKRFENTEGLEKYIEEEYNGKVDRDVRELDIRQVGLTLTELEKVIADFQNAKVYFSGINVSDKGKAGFLPNGELVLSSRYYHKPTVKLIGTGYHEAGHLLELALIHKNNLKCSEDEVIELYVTGKYAKDIVKRAYDRLRTNKSLKSLRSEISNYALTDESETIGEAVKDYYMNGFEASILSRQIIKVLQEELR